LGGWVKAKSRIKIDPALESFGRREIFQNEDVKIFKKFRLYILKKTLSH